MFSPTPARWSALLLVLAPACVGAAGRPILAPPPGPSGFPSQVSDPDVWLEARFEEKKGSLFGLDLQRYGLIPVTVRIGLRSGDAETLGSGFHLDPSTLEAVLFLQDGTALAWDPNPHAPRTSPALRSALTHRHLELSPLPPFADAREGFLFFSFDPDRVRVRGARVLSRVPGAERELSLFSSVLRLRVTGPNGLRTLSVGMQPERGRSR